MDTLRVDTLHVARALARRPAYLLACVGTLALVIGANAAIFAVVSATLLRPVPFAPGERTLAIYLNPPGTTEVRHRNPLHPIDLVRFRERSRAFARFEAFTLREKALTGGEEPEVVKGALVTHGLFAMMGVTPSVGRGFRGAEDHPRSAVAILSHGLWQRRFGENPAVLGSRILLDGEPHEIVGVMPEAFPPPFLDADVFTPFGITHGFVGEPANNVSTYAVTFGELRGDATVEQASAEIEAMTRQLAQEFPRTHAGWGGGAWPVRHYLYGEVRLAVIVLMCATAVVLLIACANLANLTMAQTIGRRGELALRVALGATRRDLLRLQVIESLMVSVPGAALGLLFARAAVPALLALSPDSRNTVGDVAIDWRVQGFTILLAVVAALLAGVLPSLRILRSDAIGILGDGSRRAAGSRTDQRVRRVLLVAQTALCLGLLLAGGVLLRSFERLARVSPGFDASQVLTAQLRLPANAYATGEQRAQAVRRLLESVRAVPGVVAASTTMNLFQPGFAFQTVFDVENKPTADGQQHTAHFRRVSPDYFKVMRIRVIAGRTFADADTADAPLVMVVSRQLAERHWGGEDPLGRRLRRGAQGKWATVIGVVDDVSDVGLQQAPEGTVYQAYAQNNPATIPIALVVRTASDPLSAASAVRAAVFSVDRNLPIHRVATLEAFMADSLKPQRFRATVLGLLAALGLLLAAVGIYGVTARGVTERTREFGVRVALGSQPRDVVRLVVAQALRAVVVGIAAGTAAGVWLSSLLGRVLTNVVEPDIATGVAAAAVLIGTATLAAAAPAVRVLRLDPVEALRAE
jgi:putative ABC transport system permease protein